MDEPASHYHQSGFPKALSRAALSVTAALMLLFFSLAIVGSPAFVLRVVAATLSIYVLMGFRLSNVPRRAERVERFMMWGLYSYILTMAICIILGVVVASW